MPRFSVKYAPEALEEIQDAIDYYNKISDRLGSRFRQNLLIAIKAAKLNPNYNSIRYDDVRFAVVKKISLCCSLHYRSGQPYSKNTGGVRF